VYTHTLDSAFRVYACQAVPADSGKPHWYREGAMSMFLGDQGPGGLLAARTGSKPMKLRFRRQIMTETGAALDPASPPVGGVNRAPA